MTARPDDRARGGEYPEDDSGPDEGPLQAAFRTPLKLHRRWRDTEDRAE